ncbi:hypothetical protein PS2_0192 [Aeromonas phage PS2]|uniref:Uncharacterized protein n=1 Tax=Aeromonas phage PS1 TaxID=2591406 RepID=A0A514TUK2_9CAUD|nr:hypothetical protein PQC64_gp073 [Aeromonas phage PS1]QDJ96701.1 hypothetical protein PS1_0190 [Aeromonas phage PS1]QFR59334.1 hypothetical protein PS2_0192 [Aeromonas phage PS2]
MSEGSIKVMEIEFKIAVRSLRFRLEEDYDTFYQKAPDSDRTDFCVKMLGIVPTHKEAGRYIVPKLLKVLDSINNGKLHTLLSNERDCRETNMLLQTEFCRSVTKIDYKGNLDFFINRDINIPESRTVLKDMFDLIVFVEAINRFIKIESIKPIFTGV